MRKIKSRKSAGKKKTDGLSSKTKSVIGLKSNADIGGSYTGCPADGSKQPIQDADDL